MDDFTDGFVMGRDAGNDGFGGGAWWILILFALLFGWGGNGWGRSSGGGGATDNYVLASDFATLQRQIDSAADRLGTQNVAISNGLCDGFYAQNSTMLNGFAGVNAALSTNGYETRNAITQAQINQMQNANALQSQLASCCCDTREAIANVNNNISSGFCAAGYNAQANTRDIIDNANANFRALNDKLTALELSAKQDKIAEQNQRITALELAASQSAQNAYLINQLRPCPIPAYPVANPYNYANNCGCGC